MNTVRVGVSVILVKDKKVLLGERLSEHGYKNWGFPGGHLELGESVENCAKREVLEETGLTVRNVKPLTFTNDIFNTKKHYITLFTTAIIDLVNNQYSDLPKVMEPDKCGQWAWFEWSDLPSPLFLPIENLVKSGFTLAK